MMKCRVCKTTLGSALLSIDAPALTSVNGLIDASTRIFGCQACGHYQSDDFGDTDEFYASSYKISLGGPEHDQLYDYVDARARFRTDVQAEIVLSIGLGRGIQVLDFGAAKADTLRKVLKAEPTWNPHVFDVSSDYEDAWQSWVPESQQAIGRMPSAWAGRFDLVTAHFVLEHVPDPAGIVSSLAGVLKPNGVLMLSVPDAASNTGDLLVADHLNHFTKSSLWTLLNDAGFRSWTILEGAFRGAFVVLARFDTLGQTSLPQQGACAPLDDELDYWQRVLRGITRLGTELPSDSLGIYGAGFYGSLIGSRLQSPPLVFLDRNDFLHGGVLLGAPVVAPEDCPPGVSVLLLGLSPRQTGTFYAAGDTWLPSGCRVVSFDEMAERAG